MSAARVSSIKCVVASKPVSVQHAVSRPTRKVYPFPVMPDDGLVCAHMEAMDGQAGLFWWGPCPYLDVLQAYICPGASDSCGMTQHEVSSEGQLLKLHLKVA